MKTVVNRLMNIGQQAKSRDSPFPDHLLRDSRLSQLGQFKCVVLLTFIQFVFQDAQLLASYVGVVRDTSEMNAPAVE